MIERSSGPWWSGNAARTRDERRLSRKERLARLHITEEEFGIYRNLFLSIRRPDTYAEQRHDGTWPQFRRRWKESLILRHLCGETNVSIPFADRIDQIVIDIDCKGNQSRRDAENTVRLVRDALPGEPLLYQSSESGGFRMIWFLDNRVSREHLHRWTEDQLDLAGITVKPGVCEVRLGKDPDRLPFGSFSMLVDTVTLDPIYHLTLSETLSIVNDHRTRFRVDVRPAAAHGGKVTRDRSRTAARLLKDGLPSDMTTNDCLLILARHGRMRLKLNDDNLEAFLWSWISENHHGNSNRMNSGNHASLQRQISRIVANLQIKTECNTLQVSRLGLNKNELTRLLDLPGDYKMLKGGHGVLCYAKAKHAACLTRKGGGYRGREGTIKWGTVFTQNEDRVNGARNFVPYIDLGKQHLRLLKVPFSSNPVRLVGWLERLGVLGLKRKAWPKGHKVRQFWVNFPFDLTEQPLSEDFDEALWDAVGYEGIRHRFTRHQAERIARKMTTRTRKELHEGRHLEMVR